MTREKTVCVFAATSVLTMLVLCAPADEVGDRPLSVSAGSDIVTTYLFRGIPQENQGFIAQPYVSASYKFFTGSNWLNDLSVQFTGWNSLHSGPTRELGDPKGWYELDLSGALAATIQNDWTFTVGYTAYTSPEGAFDTVQEVNASLSFDDSKLLKKFALHPHVLLAQEFDNQADAGNSAFISHGTHEGTYGEIGIAPQIELAQSNLDLVFPVTVGLSLRDYYENSAGHDNTFGYCDVGAELVYKPLTEPIAGIQDCTLHIGPHLVWLGDTAADIGSGVTGGDDFIVYFRAGITLNF